MRRFPFRGGVVLAATLAILTAVALGVWLGVFREERAAASPALDLTVVIASDPASGTAMAPGSIIGYTVTVTSNEATAATDGDITLEIDLDNATFVDGSLTTSSGVTCVTAPLPMDCDIDNFTGAGTKTVSFDAEVGAAGPVLAGAALDPPIDGSGPGEVTEEGNDADEVDGTNADGDDGDDVDLECAVVGEGTDAAPDEEPDNFDCTSHAVATADLFITKVPSPADGTTVGVGSEITYVLTVTNAPSAGTADDVEIRDYVGSGLDLSSVSPGTGVSCGDTVLPEINCTAASITPGQSRTVTIVVEVETGSGLLLNGAYVDPDDEITESNEAADDPTHVCDTVGEGTDPGTLEPDNYACTSHAAGAVDLTITKSASPSEGTAVTTGSTITYTLTVSNATGGGAASSVPIRDTIGSGLDLTSVSPGTGVTCADTTEPEINCTATSIGAGESRTLTIAVEVDATSGSVLNGARVDPGDSISELNEDADDPSLDCGSVGEGSDAGDATEADNFDCTSHTVTAATATPTPTPTATPTAGVLLNCPLVGKWAISVWSGPSATATGSALATCTGVTVGAAYSLDRNTNNWLRYFPGASSDVNNLLTLNDMQAIITLGR